VLCRGLFFLWAGVVPCVFFRSGVTVKVCSRQPLLGAIRRGTGPQRVQRFYSTTVEHLAECLIWSSPSLGSVGLSLIQPFENCFSVFREWSWAPAAGPRFPGVSLDPFEWPITADFRLRGRHTPSLSLGCLLHTALVDGGFSFFNFGPPPGIYDGLPVGPVEKRG